VDDGAPRDAFGESPSPRARTASIAAPSASIRMTTSHCLKTSADAPATRAPAAASGAHFAGERFQTRSGAPAFTRLSAMGSPIAPRPMKPSGAAGFIAMSYLSIRPAVARAEVGKD